MGRDPVVRAVPTSTIIQSSEISRYLLLQHVTDSSRMVQSVGDIRGAFQSCEYMIAELTISHCSSGLLSQ